MKTQLKASVMALAAAVLAFAAAPRAHATPVYTDELELISSGSTVLVTGTGVTSFSGSVGSFSINITTGITYPTQGTLGSPVMDLSSVNVSGGTGSLEILFSATGFGPTAGHFLDEIGGTVNNAGGSIAYSVYENPSDALLGTTNLVGSLGPYGSGAFSGTTLSSFLSLSSPYSLTQEINITHAAGGTSSFDANLSVVPDGGWTVALLGITLGGLGMLRRKMAGSRNEMVA
jgi:hypothetical protein